MLCSGSGLRLSEEARLVFAAVSRAAADAGGWLIEDGVRGGSANGFAELMEERAAGVLPWETVCPAASSNKPRARREMKLPYTALAYMGSPCWALRRHLYTLDLFNPANELMLPYSQEARYWQVTPWPVRFWSDAEREKDFGFKPFAGLIVAAAEAIEAPYGFGGNGLSAAVSAALSNEAWRDLLRSGGKRLSDYLYPSVLCQRASLSDADVQALTKHPLSFFGGAKVCRPSFAQVVGERGQYVMLGLAAPPEGYPVGDYDLCEAVGRMLGRTYIAVALKERLTHGRP